MLLLLKHGYKIVYMAKRWVC